MITRDLCPLWHVRAIPMLNVRTMLPFDVVLHAVFVNPCQLAAEARLAMSIRLARGVDKATWKTSDGCSIVNWVRLIRALNTVWLPLAIFQIVCGLVLL